jgi:hypothetical protein
MLLLFTSIRQKLMLWLNHIRYICIVQTRFIQTLNNRVNQKKDRCNEKKSRSGRRDFFMRGILKYSF